MRGGCRDAQDARSKCRGAASRPAADRPALRRRSKRCRVRRSDPREPLDDPAQLTRRRLRAPFLEGPTGPRCRETPRHSARRPCLPLLRCYEEAGAPYVPEPPDKERLVLGNELMVVSVSPNGGPLIMRRPLPTGPAQSGEPLPGTRTSGCPVRNLPTSRHRCRAWCPAVIPSRSVRPKPADETAGHLSNSASKARRQGCLKRVSFGGGLVACEHETVARREKRQFWLSGDDPTHCGGTFEER